MLKIFYSPILTFSPIILSDATYYTQNSHSIFMQQQCEQCLFCNITE